MLDFLVKKGAPLRLSKRKPHLHQLLQFALDCGPSGEGETLERVQYIVGAGYDLQHSSFPTASFLEACESSRIFEHLYRNGAQLRPGSPLAAWIHIDGGLGLCEKMLKAGADPNAYARYNRIRWAETPLQAAAWKCSLDVVELLIKAGSDVNAPAKGQDGLTALQASCTHLPDTLEDRDRQLRITHLLLAHGADINAAPGFGKGRTALQGAAESGNLAAAKLLLFHRPMADVNAPPCAQSWSQIANDNLQDNLQCEKWEIGTALDLAARHGRLDMVKLLLNCNALSHCRGETGYDGAIKEARYRGNLAVADLILQHAEDARRSGTTPYLPKSQRTWREYNYQWDPDENSQYSEDKEESATSSDIDDLDAPEDVWERNAIGCLSSDIHEDDDSSAAAHDHDAHDLAYSLAHGDFQVALANDTNAWTAHGFWDLTQGEDLMKMCHFQTLSQEVDFDAVTNCNAAMESDMSLHYQTGQEAFGQYADPQDLEYGSIDVFTYAGLPDRDVMEVEEDDE